jgi:glyoxylate reductase
VARVLVTRRLTEGGTDPLVAAGHEVVTVPDDVPLTHDELEERAPTYDGIVCLLTDRVDAAVLQAGQAGRLRVVGNAAVGYDNIDVARAHALGVVVCNTPGVLDATTADLAFLLILTATRGRSSPRALDRLGLRHPPGPRRA